MFGEFNKDISDQRLENIYWRHQNWVKQSAKIKQQQLLCVTLTEIKNDAKSLEEGKNWPAPISVKLGDLLQREPSENIHPIVSSYNLNQGRVTAWAGIKHGNKVASQLRGPNGRKYYDYSLMDT